ncbi:hypothetical protein ACFX12_030734 [Malus domestica]
MTIGEARDRLSRIVLDRASARYLRVFDVTIARDACGFRLTLDCLFVDQMRVRGWQPALHDLERHTHDAGCQPRTRI